MATGRYSRLDGRKTSANGSMITIVVFVALCLVGIWVITSSSLVSVPNSRVSHENKNEVTTQEAESNVENNSYTQANENSDDVPMEDNSGKGNENSNIATEDNNAKESENSNDEIMEDNVEENDDGEQKQFDDSEGNLPEDAIKVDNNERLNQVEKNQNGAERVEKSSDKSEDAMEGGGVVGNKQEEMKDSSENGGAKEVDGEAAEDNGDGVKHSDENSGKIDVEKKGDHVDKNDDNDKRSEENSGKAAEEKSEDRVEEKLDNKKDGSEKDSNEKSGNVEITTQENQVVEKTKNKKDDNEKGSEENSGKTDVEKRRGSTKEKLDNNKDDSKKTFEENAGKIDVEKKDGVEKVESNKTTDDDKIFAENPGNVNVTKQKVQKDLPADQGFSNKEDQPSQVFPSGDQSEINNNTYSWKLCKTKTGPDYIPCLDNIAAIKKLKTTKHYEHRERHCPENPPTCLVPIPQGYQPPIEWPNSRDKIWFHNVPHTKLAEFKGHQNWVKVSGEFLAFPGGGTQFQHGALHYIDFIQESVPDIAWGKKSRVCLDVGCGVASFGGFLFDRDVLTMSLAPKDEHEAQVQFALERGIPAISAVMGTQRFLYPGRVFDVIQCARCRVPWHIEGGRNLLELNRLLRPGGFFIWSATPVYQKLPEDMKIWEEMKKLTKSMCWEMVSIIHDKVNKVGIAIYRKPTSNECYEKRPENDPPVCPDSDDPDAAWNVPLKACMHKIPVAETERGSKWPEPWPTRVEIPPYWLSSTEVGVYGKPAPEDFVVDYEYWKGVVKNSYLNGLGIKWSTVRNVMDMQAVYGGLAAALKELNVWVMNVVSIDAPDTLPIIYERGLFGIYHDWCQSFSTYPRSYDLLHADHLFSKINKKCNLSALVAETDRILRPEGKIIVRDDDKTLAEVETIFKSLQWDVQMMSSKNMQGMIVAKKTMWRPVEEEVLKYAIS